MIWFIAILCIAVTGHDLYQTWQGRSRAIEEARREAANLAWSAAQHAEAAFRLADTVLNAIVERVEIEGAGPAQLERLRNLLARGLPASQIQDVLVIDETGSAIVNGQPANRGISVVDSALFHFHMTHADRQTSTTLLRSRVTGNWTVAGSRRINHADGGFGGVVIATIDASYFQSFLATFDLGREGGASILSDSGVVLVREPFIAAAVGGDLAGGPFFRQLAPTAASGVFETISPTDGIQKIFAYRRVAGYPLIAIVGLGRDERLANWRASALEHVAAAIVVAVLLSFFAVRLFRQMRSLERAGQAALATSARLQISDATMREDARELARHVAALERSNKELDDFAYIASHDLKEPLRGLVNNAKFLLEDYAEKLDAAGAGRLARLGYLGHRMEQLIDDLLYFSRLGRLELAIQPTDLNAVIRDIALMSETTLQERNAIIVIPRPLPRLSCDKTRITEVFRNLIVNAVKYNDAALKRVEVGYLDEVQTNAGVERQVFYVKDNGVGIAEEFHEDIFGMFKRLNSEDDDKKGSGVGLTFVRKIVERQGGRIWLRSAPGEGAIFYFTIERGTAHEAAA